MYHVYTYMHIRIHKLFHMYGYKCRYFSCRGKSRDRRRIARVAWYAWYVGTITLQAGRTRNVIIGTWSLMRWLVVTLAQRVGGSGCSITDSRLTLVGTRRDGRGTSDDFLRGRSARISAVAKSCLKSFLFFFYIYIARCSPVAELDSGTPRKSKSAAFVSRVSRGRRKGNAFPCDKATL